MDVRPIGIFDSGLGGLTAAKALEELLPGESLVYFGDSANAPYGTRSREELLSLACANAAFLQRFRVKLILAACGTVSSTVIEQVRARCGVPIVDVVAPAVAAVAALRPQRVAIAATAATVASGAFERRLREALPEAALFSKACQELVITVERGHFCPGDPFAEEAVARSLEAVKRWQPEILVLGCTHFPLLERTIAAYLGPEVRLLSVSEEAVRALDGILRRDGLRSGQREGTRRYFTSGSLPDFAEYAEIFLGHKISPEPGMPSAAAEPA